MEKRSYLSVRLDQELHDKVRYAAGYDGRSMNGYVISLLQKAVLAFEKEHGPITEEDIAGMKK